MNTASGLTNEMIRNKALYDSIDMYLKDGETKDGIMKQFKNNVVEAIKFLRSRSYETLEVVKRKPKPSPKPEPSIIDPIFDPPATDYLPKEKKKKKDTKAKPTQEKLF